MDISSVGIVLTTYYPKWYVGKLRSSKHAEKVRGDLALEFITIAAKQGYKVIVSDGRSAKTFKKKLTNIPDIIVVKQYDSKQAASKREGIRRISKNPSIKAIVFCEPEKVSLLTDCMHDIVAPLLSDSADIVIPKREPKLFKETYPGYMYESEIEGNHFYNEALRTNGLLGFASDDLDLFFGPRAFRNDAKTVSLFLRKYTMNTSHLSFPEKYFDVDRYSNILFFPVINALKKKFRVKSVTVPFKYPKTQKDNEEKGARELFIEKRRSQKLGILVELLHFMAYLGSRRKSRMKVVNKK